MASYWINLDDILDYSTGPSGDLDQNRIRASILNAQIVYMEDLLGSDLYNKIDELVISSQTDMGSLTGTNYYTLLVEYITPSLVNHTLELFVPFNTYIVANNGTLQRNVENAEGVSQELVEYYSNKYKQLAYKYDKKLKAYLDKNKTLFTEYTTNTGLTEKTELVPDFGIYLGDELNDIKIRR